MAYSPHTLAELDAAAALNQHPRVLAQLTPKELSSSASKWTRRHLFPYRLLVSPDADFLPPLAHDHNSSCPVCASPLSEPTQTICRAQTQALIGSTPQDLCAETDHELLKLPHGAFWVALARAVRSEADGSPRAHPRRERRQVQHNEYVHSTHAIDGSSPRTEPSCSDYDVDTSLVDDDDHAERRGKPEDVTVNLVSLFLQQALGVCLLQHRQGRPAEVEVRPRMERQRATAMVAGRVSIAAEDDGGICLMRRTGPGWQMRHPYWALIEAKRAFASTDTDGDPTDHFRPTISDGNLAQYLGEAIITWKANPELLPHSKVFLIAATNTFVRFIQFSFGCDYLQYLDAPDVETQLEIITDLGKAAHVSMQSSRWINLQSSTGRKAALCHVLALLRWHVVQGSVHHQGDQGDLDDDDDDDGDSWVEDEDDETEDSSNMDMGE
ncbi:hypothetical protein QBC39DRAFT_360092 [Podospora conica]|nr:hypothetical protein QBC39DRAFT_360092 [Schizothecium conicum]